VLITNIKAKSSQSIGEDYKVVKGTDTLEEAIMGRTFRYSAQGFFQNNSVMAEKMHEYVHGLLKKYDTSGAHLLDLYGGVGAFGIVNADLFKGVTSVESFEGCTVAAKENIELNKLKNVEAICMDAKRLKQVKLPAEDLYVITDPPRSGMHQETIIQLKKLKPNVIIYISCNVEQLGKDLPKFSDYKIKSVALFDLFPQTNHMESVVELS
jgi:23S rRNA (uracil1939-C5)-methyltransferase